MKKSLRINGLLLLLIILLIGIPLVLLQDQEFAGADSQAVDLISEVAPEYQPWFSGIWSPPSAEIESLLFALQAALGAGVICYVFGYLRGKGVVKEG